MAADGTPAYDQEGAKPVGFAPVTASNWPSVASERLPDLTEISGGRSGQHHALQLGG
jgi:hypothetical protein